MVWNKVSHDLVSILNYAGGGGISAIFPHVVNRRIIAYLIWQKLQNRNAQTVDNNRHRHELPLPLPKEDYKQWKENKKVLGTE